MKLFKYSSGVKSCSLFFYVFACILFITMAGHARANVLILGKNVTLSFSDMQANFAAPLEGSGICGVLHLATPLDACFPLANQVASRKGTNISFALIVRGGCTFEDKVRRAQNAGFAAAIVFDNVGDGSLVAMAGNKRGIRIHAVFISKASGEVLKNYVGSSDVEFWLVPTFENSAWSIMAVSFICLLAVSAVLATCFFVRRHRIRHDRRHLSLEQKPCGMSRRSVRAMPSMVFTSVTEDNCTSMTCAICLDDYCVGEKLRVLPCCHKFHAVCVDSWLTTWRSFCPVCKRDARSSSGYPLISECTPLLSSRSSSSAVSVASSATSHFLTTTPPIHIGNTSLPSGARPVPATSIHSFSRSPYDGHSYMSTSALSSTGSSTDLRNAFSHRSPTSYLMSPHPSAFSCLPSPFISGCSSFHNLSQFVQSASRLPFLHNYGESMGSMPSPAVQSLSGC